MPSLELKTNVKLDDPKAFVVEFSKFSAEVLGKPIAYICVSYTYNEYLAWEGTFEPAFLLNIVSLDNISPKLNEEYSEKLFAFVKEKLNIDHNRGYINFSDPGRDHLGHRSTTFGSIFGRK
ncbi:Tautomerase/MIF [Abortiporus biennis]|nr:Tautomerase/MIF [Abortiporus biennis]